MSEMFLYAVVGPASRELLSFRNCVIVHTDIHELGWVFKYCKPVRFREFGRPTIMLEDYVRSQGQSWPLDKREWS